MDLARRYEVFAEADLGVLERWSDAVLSEADVRVVQQPSSELAMMQVRDPVSGGLFFLGEVLMQVCRVTIGDVAGCGYALGSDAPRALCAAILDAALNAHHRLSDGIAAALQAEAVEVHRRRVAESRLVERSRVRFEVLEG
jgi:alpha-D-ribose 1-methylphosphonate 5-triphosphate synthase subunit PhnG